MTAARADAPKSGRDRSGARRLETAPGPGTPKTGETATGPGTPKTGETATGTGTPKKQT